MTDIQSPLISNELFGGGLEENAERWAVHIIGLDDVIEMPDEITALREANVVNKLIAQDRKKFANDPNYPFSIAIVRTM